MSAYGAWLILVKFVALCILVVHFFIDWEYQILPDSLNIVLGVLLLSYALFNFSWSYWLLGALIGAGFPFLVTWGFYLVRGQIGLGGGDIKLFGVLGLFLGPLGIIHTIFLRCIVGAFVGGTAIFLGKMTKEKPIAFGPFIIVIAALQIYFPNFVAHYLIFI
jgi:leader peptidase (prepilin peptidase)/N-methyltransferase